MNPERLLPVVQSANRTFEEAVWEATDLQQRLLSSDTLPQGAKVTLTLSRDQAPPFVSVIVHFSDTNTAIERELVLLAVTQWLDTGILTITYNGMQQVGVRENVLTQKTVVRIAKELLMAHKHMYDIARP